MTTFRKVADLTGAELDAAVARAERQGLTFELRGAPVRCFIDGVVFASSSDWSQGGPIIERAAIELVPGEVNDDSPVPGVWWAIMRRPQIAEGQGAELLVAAMRACVTGHLGSRIELDPAVHIQ